MKSIAARYDERSPSGSDSHAPDAHLASSSAALAPRRIAIFGAAGYS